MALHDRDNHPHITSEGLVVLAFVAVCALLAFLAVEVWGQQTHDSGPLPTFTVSAARHNIDTVVTLTYPRKHNVWVCVIFRRPVEPDYTPRWCFSPEHGAEAETMRVPRWPPVPSTDTWEVSGILQWEIDRYNFGYAETGWSTVR